MLYSQIKAQLSTSPFFQSLPANLSAGKRVQIHHLNQSARALVAAHLWVSTGKNVLIVSQDDIIAEDIWDDLSAIVGRENAHYLPDYEILPYEERSPHYSIRATRMLCLYNCMGEIPAIYSLSVRALLRYIPPKKSIARHIIHLKPGMEYPPDKLLQDLHNCGYEMEYQVSKVYQAARRGGIMDVFSPPLLKPVRIEFFGDEILSMRTFSANTQRSEPGELDEVTIIPARELCLDDIDHHSLLSSKIKTKGFYEGIENQLSLLLPELETFADYFESDQRLVLMSNFSYVLEEVQQLGEQILSQYQKDLKHKTKAKLSPPERLMAGEEYLYKLIKQSCSAFLSQSEFVLPFTTENIKAPFAPQPAFGGDLDLLASHLKQNAHQRSILLFDNPSQSNRMDQLLADFQVKAEHHIGVLHEGFSVTDAGLTLWTDHEIFNRYKRKRYAPRFAPGEEIVDYQSLKPGDYVVHVDHGIGVFEGLKIIRLDRQDTECLVLRYANDDRVYVPTHQLRLVSKYVAEEGASPVLHRIGSNKWQNTKRRATEQIELIAADIVKLYAERASRVGISHKADGDWQRELEESFIYEDTIDQTRSTNEVKADMEASAPMERLLCGDVGFGKTEVAIRAAFKAVCSGYQCAVLVPTTLLAEQHWRVFRERLAQYPIRIAMLSRFRSPLLLKKDIAGIAAGEVDIAIGTHRLLSSDLHFSRLGLLIIDEEHRFGVRHKERLRKLQSNVDTLYMSATPIPRTLNMALAKLKEISLMQTSPKERLPIRTIITPRDTEVIKDAIGREIDRGGQVFFIHNRVQTIETVAMELRNLMPGVSFVVGHAQMPEKHLEHVMEAFINRDYQVLISTTIVENGIDIANANTILIDRADTFGLAQLYQMRGRVGRSNRRAYAYLLIPKGTTTEARHRLEALTQYDFLGAGFQVALRDLELRGAGAILGTKQSGIIQSIGFNYYNSLLGKAITAVETGDPELLHQDDSPQTRRQLKTEIDLYFPPEYIDNDEQRLRIYRRLSEFENLEELNDMERELTDRFGALPETAHWLLMYFKLNILAKVIELQNCYVRSGTLALEFKADKMPPKESVLAFGAKVPHPMRFDTSKGLKISIDLDKKLSYREQFSLALNLLSKWE
ncbi:MAG: transcription-repair coupling factor [Candidatus Cloacimonadaceae bacterium]|nr:transcription-repair coupling factor [Candidatus Cloacimonadaceae bacterium]